MMGPRGGLTLIEVLVSLTLMTVFIASSVPLIRDATLVLESGAGAEGTDLLAFEKTVDLFLEEPLEFGWSPDSKQHMFFSTELQGSAPVHVTRLSAQDPEVKHGWMVFERSDQSTVRWVPPEADDSELPEEAR